MYCIIHSQNPVYYYKFRHALVRHIQPLCDIFRTLCNSCIFRILAYLKPKIYPEFCQGIFWHIQNDVYLLHIESPAIFRTLPYLGPQAYSGSCLYRQIQVYLIIIVLIPLTFFFQWRQFNDRSFKIAL